MKKRKSIIGAVLVLFCCIAVGIGVKVNADKANPEEQVTVMSGETVINKIVENQDGSTTTTTTVTSDPISTADIPGTEIDFSLN